jgi:hypothetical protein
MEKRPSVEHILQVGMGFWASKALLSAVEMELFTELAQQPRDLASLQSRLRLHPRSARDFLDALVALGFLERVDGVYRNTPSTNQFLDKRKHSYIGGILEMANHRLFAHWNHLTVALRTGKPQNETRGGSASLFETIYADPGLLKEFLGAMTGVSHAANEVLAAKFPWKGYRTVADIGTAQGDLVVQVVQRNDHLRGTGFDLPEVAPIFEDHVASHGLQERVRFMAGDFFAQPLPKADVLMMGHILHDWGFDEKMVLIRKAYEALPAGGALIVYESIIDDGRCDNAFGLLMSLNMLIETQSGFDFTGADCMGWMREAGFSQTRVEPLVGSDSMVVAIK